MWPDVVVFLQVQGVAHQAQHLESPVVKAEQCANAYVVALGLHGAGYAVQSPQEVRLVRVLGMNPAICFVMIGLLENLICADAGLFHDAVAFVIQGSGVQVDAANLTAAGFRGIDLPHALGHEFGRIARMLAENQNEPLVSLVF